MILRKTFTLAAGASLLTMGLPLIAQETPPSAETPAPPEVPSTPAPVEAPPPPAPPETPAPPAPPPAQAEQMPANPAPGTMPGAQDTNVTNPPPAAQAVYPPCSKTVSDQCQQREGRATKRRPR